MKSILNDVNRLEKAWELLERLANACHCYINEVNDHNKKVSDYESGKVMLAEFETVYAFLEKHGDK